MDMGLGAESWGFLVMAIKTEMKMGIPFNWLSEDANFMCVCVLELCWLGCEKCCQLLVARHFTGNYRMCYPGGERMADD